MLRARLRYRGGAGSEQRGPTAQTAFRQALLKRGRFQRPSERPPQARLPRLATAHRARRQFPADRDRISALGAAELPFHMIAGGRKRDYVAVGGCGRTLPGCGHPDPLDRPRVNLTTEMIILPPWRQRNRSLPAA